MSRALGLFVIGLVFGGGLGFTGAAGNGITLNGHDYGDPAIHAGMAMNHSGGAHDMAHATALEVSPVDAPEVAIDLTRDPMEGYNLHVQTSNFAFTPEAVGLGDVPGEGHAHVYVNGNKLGRLYGEWMHITHLPKGEVTVAVTLNSNNHSSLAVAGKPITATALLTVQ